jgi:hypothetical protein
VKVLGIGIKGVATTVYEEIAGQMSREKTAEPQTGYGHQPLFADGRRECLREPVHACLRVHLVL